jgi:hypothetical protein
MANAPRVQRTAPRVLTLQVYAPNVLPLSVSTVRPLESVVVC